MLNKYLSRKGSLYLFATFSSRLALAATLLSGPVFAIGSDRELSDEDQPETSTPSRPLGRFGRNQVCEWYCTIHDSYNRAKKIKGEAKIIRRDSLDAFVEKSQSVDEFKDHVYGEFARLLEFPQLMGERKEKWRALLDSDPKAFVAYWEMPEIFQRLVDIDADSTVIKLAMGSFYKSIHVERYYRHGVGDCKKAIGLLADLPDNYLKSPRFWGQFINAENALVIVHLERLHDKFLVPMSHDHLYSDDLKGLAKALETHPRYLKQIKLGLVENDENYGVCLACLQDGDPWLDPRIEALNVLDQVRYTTAGFLPPITYLGVRKLIIEYGKTSPAMLNCFSRMSDDFLRSPGVVEYMATLEDENEASLKNLPYFEKQIPFAEKMGPILPYILKRIEYREPNEELIHQFEEAFQTLPHEDQDLFAPFQGYMRLTYKEEPVLVEPLCLIFEDLRRLEHISIIDMTLMAQPAFVDSPGHNNEPTLP